MNGPQDLGGMMGFGPIAPNPNEPLFHGDWEKRVLGMMLAVGGTGSWTIDQSRHARETLPHQQYRSLSYYEIWFEGLLKLLQARGMVSARDWWAQRVVDEPIPVKRVLKVVDVAAVLAKGSRYDRPGQETKLFQVGDQIKAVSFETKLHTRLPAYLRGQFGVVVAYHGSHVFPDANAHGLGENPQHLYCVRFKCSDVFATMTADTVHADLWEPYLEAV